MFYGLAAIAKNHDREGTVVVQLRGERNRGRRMVILIERVITLIVGSRPDKLRL